MRTLAVTCVLVASLSGCASLPPESEAARLRDSITRFADVYSAVATTQLADADPTNDAKARKILEITTLVRAVLAGDTTDALTKLLAAQKDPYVGALVVFILSEIQAYQKAADAAKVIPPTP